ncbi:hypothetical protein MSPP1_003580 [Malassezia sp. CBS 17886]|nr:hypothetical protein MSPP1_003580 [Malassezia sp. CBS 17886]
MAAARAEPAATEPTHGAAMRSAMDEEYMLLVLSDSNLPTGGFIASMGLESYYQHGFMTDGVGANTQTHLAQRTVEFADYMLENYVASVLPYMHAAYILASRYINGETSSLDDTAEALARLDWHHHTLLLNHVARRASMIQGIALLSLYVRSFAQPAPMPGTPRPDARAVAAKQLVDRIRLRAYALHGGDLPGHFPICSGVFCSAVGVSTADRMLHLNMFLQTRNLISCSIRLNTVGPYMAHQLLVFQLRSVMERRLRGYSVAAGATLLRVVTRGLRMFYEDAAGPGKRAAGRVGKAITQGGETDRVHSPTTHMHASAPATGTGPSFTGAPIEAGSSRASDREVHASCTQTGPPPLPTAGLGRAKTHAPGGAGDMSHVNDSGPAWDWDWPDEDLVGPVTTWPLGDVVQGRHDQLHSRLFNS